MKKSLLFFVSILLGHFFFLTPFVASAQHIPSISITFDDGLRSADTYGTPGLSHYRIPATMYVVTSMAGIGKYLSFSELKAMQENGWEIGSHSHTHLHMDEISFQEAEKELMLSKEILREHGFNPVSFAAPYGDYNEILIRATRKHYHSMRLAWDDWEDRPITGRGGRNGVPLTDVYRISAVTVTNTMTVDAIKKEIALAIQKKRWFVLLFHGLVPENEKMGIYDYPAEKFAEIIAHIAILRDKGSISILTVQDAVQSYTKP